MTATSLGCFLAAAIMSVFFFTPEANATTYYRWCTAFNSQFDDSSNTSGYEDQYTSTSKIQRRAEYAQYTIYDCGSGGCGGTKTAVETSYLTSYDSTLGRYCSNYIAITANHYYLFRWRTIFKRSNRYAYINSGSTFGSTYVSRSSSSGPLSDSGGYHSVDKTVSTINTQYSSAPVVSRMMDWANTFGWENYTANKIQLVTEAGGDCGTNGSWQYKQYSGGAFQVCAVPSGDTTHKFWLGHELAHAIFYMRVTRDQAPKGAFNADSKDGVDSDVPFYPSIGDYTYDEECRCNHLGSGDPEDDPPGNYPYHCFISREFIGRASIEGYAYFLSAAVFNARATNGYFGYYKKLKDHPSDCPVYDSDTPFCWMIPINTNEKHMVNTCDPDGDDTFNVGTDRDWMQFFWNLWVDYYGTAYEYSTDDMTWIWDNTDGTSEYCDPDDPTDCGSSSGTRTWEADYGRIYIDLVSTVGNSGWSTTKKGHFNSRAEDAGVDY